MNNFNIHYSRKEYREEYLSSPEWRAKSDFILNRDKVCRICDKEKSQDAHHLTYENLPFEDLDKDLIGVCRKCHNKIHSWEWLTRTSDINKIRRLIALSKRKWPISMALVSKMNAAHPKIKKMLSGLMGKNLYFYDELLGRKMPFSLYVKIKGLLKKKIPISVPRKKEWF